ncbi:muramoyltetrapeptide carboxypeptidase [Thermoflavifilum aggregans]|uniref:Muramoyltetrapeptide carboxypeptidase n=1 Tax=Thermoflavifilum aggregans TaxID=454188 RepID=A0A2M9CT21_9BACT|nr:LD-carboxypeptidase [Thermoflavifilum aggregans]PJJ75080.1 muramoyltetrapeptide carboxypeptidase [Thermoflavifilum aggregans]
MVIPPYLNPGDCVGITCPASKITPEAARFAADVIRSWGYDVVLGETVGTAYHNFSAPDEVRLRDLQMMLDDPSIKAILFGRGGYGMIRILDQLRFDKFLQSPKWICGYSDITALHMHVHTHYQVPTLHSMMCSGITQETREDRYVQSLKQAWTVIPGHYSFDMHPLNKTGYAEGVLIGGNLSLLANLSGTRSQPDSRGKILFIEDVGEYKYHIDRMMYQLRRAGWLNGLAALLVGAFTDIKDTITPFGMSVYEIIYQHVKDEIFPVAFGFPVGHQKENYALKIGCKYALTMEESNCVLKEIVSVA